MARSHKFAVKTKGLSDEDAARLHYLISCAAYAMCKSDKDAYETISNVSVSVLKKQFPGEGWEKATAAERASLVK